MKRSAKIAIIAIIGVVIVVMATVFAYSVINNEQLSTSPFSYIPSNSSLVLYLNYNNTKAFVFHGYNYTALMVTSANIKGSNITIPSGNKTYDINTTLYQSYKGFQVYSLNISSILPGFQQYSNFSNYLNISKINATVFAYVPYGSTIVLGSLSSIHSSINAYANDNNFQSKSIFVNLDNNVSFYVSPMNTSSPIVKAWGGLNETTVYSFLDVKNGTSLNLSYLQIIPGVKVTTISQNEIEISFPLSYLSTFMSKEKIA
ncbi:MAG: hypothetical protein QXO03_03730 [Thermoplasmatales archaeon]